MCFKRKKNVEMVHSLNKMVDISYSESCKELKTLSDWSFIFACWKMGLNANGSFAAVYLLTKEIE